jgi:hypothetical protein
MNPTHSKTRVGYCALRRARRPHNPSHRIFPRARTQFSITLAPVNPQRISFARTLPILTLLLSYVILAVPTGLTYVKLHRASGPNGDAIITTPQHRLLVHNEHFLRYSLTSSSLATSRAIQGINLPARSIEYTIDESTRTWPNRWSPHGVYPATWQAISFPIYCLPFWCFVGFGLDSISGRHRLRLKVLLPASLFWFLWASSFLFFIVGPEPNLLAQRFDISFVVRGLALWTLLLGVFPVGWIIRGLALQRSRERLHAGSMLSCNEFVLSSLYRLAASDPCCFTILL